MPSSYLVLHGETIVAPETGPHMQLLHLKPVLTCLSGAGLTDKPEKCQLGAHTHNRLCYLGYMVRGGQLRPTQDKVLAIKDDTRPFIKKNVRSFLGLTGYYRRFITNYADIAAPLSD